VHLTRPPLPAWLFVVSCAFLVAVSGCKESDDSDPIGDGGSPRTRDNETAECTSCDDGFGCTIDRCVSGGCMHSIGANSGETACPDGRYCVVAQGCVSAPACATDEDCESAFEGDACKDEPRCDPASSVCTFELLDKDGDGSAPQICGGDDCDDNARGVHPGAVDGCNGRDDDCDGDLDEEPSCSEKEECVDGACSCLPEFLCGNSCVDTDTDREHCGECDNECPMGAACSGGACECPRELDVCDDGCVDLNADDFNCGACGLACPREQFCKSGACGCGDVPSFLCTNTFNCEMVQGTPCSETCVDAISDPSNCGGCGNACEAGDNQVPSCAEGLCLIECAEGFGDCDGLPETGCEQDVGTDAENCGACGRGCAGAACSNGRCELEVVADDVVGSLFELKQDDEALYWTSVSGLGAGLEIRSVSKAGGHEVVLKKVESFLDTGVALFQYVVDPEQICWALPILATPETIDTEVTTELWCADKTDGTETLVATLDFPVIDLESDGVHLYFLGDPYYPTRPPDRVWRVRIAENEQTEVVSTSEHPERLFMDGTEVYWVAMETHTSGNWENVIFRAPKTGGTGEEFESSPMFGALALGDDNVFVVDAEDGPTLLAIDKDNASRTTVAKATEIHDVASDGETVFWAEDSRAVKWVNGKELRLAQSAQGLYQRVLVDTTHVYLMHAWGGTNEILRVAK
jgi:hypothetical protein